MHVKNKAALTLLLITSILILSVSFSVLTQILNGSLDIGHGWIWLPGIPLGLIGIAYTANELKH